MQANAGYVYKHEEGLDDGQPLGGDPVAIDAFIESADMTIEDGNRYACIYI